MYDNNRISILNSIYNDMFGRNIDEIDISTYYEWTDTEENIQKLKECIIINTVNLKNITNVCYIDFKRVGILNKLYNEVFDTNISESIVNAYYSWTDSEEGINRVKKDFYKNSVSHKQIKNNFTKKDNTSKNTKEDNIIIPLNIFQTWNTLNLPPKMKENVELLKTQNPEFNYHLFDDDMCRDFISNNFDADVLDAFDTLSPGAYKADLWRYCVLYINGGIYLDIKYKCVDDFKLIELTTEEHFVKDIIPNNVYNALIVALPKNIKLLQCINQIVKNVKNKFYGDGILSVTGPKLLSKYFNSEEYNNLKTYFTNKDWCPNLSDTYNEGIFFNDNRLILGVYVEYRLEQKIFQKNKHYIELYNEKNIYKIEDNYKDISNDIYMFIPRDAGFFSVFNFLLGSLHNGYKVYPYFNLNKMIERHGIVQHFAYLDDKDNCWFDFFEKIKFDPKDDNHENIGKLQNCKISVGEDEAPIEFKEPHAVTNLLLTDKSEFTKWRYSVNDTFKKYISFNPFILNKVNEITKLFDEVTIAVHYRHPSHCCEAGYKYFNDYFDKINDILSIHPNATIFLATDNELGVAAFTKEYGSKVIYNTESTRTSFNNILEWAFSLIGNKQNHEGFINGVGFQVHHTSRKNNSSNINLAYEVIIDTICISKCNYFIHGTSNISLAASYMNPELEMVYI